MPDTAYIDIQTNYIHDNTLTKLANMAALRDNWDGYGAKPLPRDTIYKAQRLIQALHVRPEIFPTATGSIQFEFDKDNGDYLELQFTGKGLCEAFRCIRGNEEYLSLPDNSSSLNVLVEDFLD